MEATKKTLESRREKLSALIQNLNQLVLDGHVLEAFDEYYADEVVMQENAEEPTVGKEANRVREEQFLNSLVEFRGARVDALAIDAANNKTMVEWYYDYTHAEWGERRYRQVSVQEWDGDKIVAERFYYGA